jgi:hypothetical protein
VHPVYADGFIYPYGQIYVCTNKFNHLRRKKAVGRDNGRKNKEGGRKTGRMEKGCESKGEGRREKTGDPFHLKM